jgi:GDPmannose 4,6-dehydratase
MEALITGITEQDGYFLSQFLLDKGYDVYGIVRRNSNRKMGNLDLLPERIKRNIHILEGDTTNTNFIIDTLEKLKPNELYHLAGQSFVTYSFTNSTFTYDVNIGETLIVVNAVKDYSNNTRLYFAGTYDLFGKVTKSLQNEETPFYPASPYAISKRAGFWTVRHTERHMGPFYEQWHFV